MMYGKDKKKKMMDGGRAKYSSGSTPAKKMKDGGRAMYKDGGMPKATPC